VGCREEVPVWHEAIARWIREGKLAVLGITQEQHAERCQLLAQWKGFSWPILHDPINILGLTGVPELLAIDEQGIVRMSGPDLKRFEADFVNRTFPKDLALATPARLTPSRMPGRAIPDFELLYQRASKADSPVTWRELGDALALWGGDDHISSSVDAYTMAVRRQPDDGAAWFRLGVCYRRRYDSPARQPGDFQRAVDNWGKALALNPNQYIWRRRIQQYGPRLDKPYAFYDWVPEAELAIRQRGQQPTSLPVRPEGAEIAQPLRDLPEPARIPQPPDPTGQVARDREGWVRAEVTIVPAQVRAGQAARVHVVLRLDAAQHAHWNNEAEPLRLWVDPPPGGKVSDQLLTAARVRRALSDEDRALDFEVKVAQSSSAKVQMSAYACYNICQGPQGQCRFLRLDVPITIQRAN
jgi:hypothetical protein